MNYYPVFLNLAGKKALVVGGGRVAERKVLSLLAAGAGITVVSPSLTKRLAKQASEGRITHRARNYRRGDLKGAFLVIAATDDSALNRQVAIDAPALVNVVDVPGECNFIAPSVVRRDPLIVAVSTSGASPALSRAIRKELEVLYGPGFSDYLRFVKKIRAKALKEIPDGKKRMKFLKTLASEETLKTIREKGPAAVKKKAEMLFAGLRK